MYTFFPWISVTKQIYIEQILNYQKTSAAFFLSKIALQICNFRHIFNSNNERNIINLNTRINQHF